MIEHTPFPGEVLYSEVARRLGRMEDMAHKFDTHVATEDLKFDSLSSQITQLGKDLGGSLEKLSQRVDKLDQKTQSNSEQLSAVLSQHSSEEKSADTRAKWFWRVVAIVGIPVAGLLTRFGEAMWDTWFGK